MGASYWKGVALTLLLATTINANTNERNLAIVKDTLYSPAKAGKPNYYHHGQNGGHTGPRPKTNGRGGKGGKATSGGGNWQSEGEEWETEWGGFGYSKGSKAQSTPLQWESAAWGESDEEIAVENEYTEEEGIDMGTIYSEDYPNADDEGEDVAEEGMGGEEGEEEEEEVTTVYQVHPEPTGQLPVHSGGGKGGKLPIHHGQNGGHTGPRPTSHNAGGSKGGKAAHGGEWNSVTHIEDTMDANISSDEDTHADSTWVGMEDASQVNTDIHDSWAASTSGWASGGKAGKATISQPIKGTSSWSSGANAVKTTSWTAPPVKTEDTTIHSSNDASWHSPSSDTSTTVSESMKPKAEKQPLTEYFIKEPTGWGGAPIKKDSKSGKSSKTKSSKKHVEWGGSGASDNSWNDHGPVWKGSGKAVKDHPPVSTSSDEEEGFYLYTTDEQVCTFIPGELTNITMEGAETFATKVECCDKYPQGCQEDTEAVPVPSPADGLTPTEDLNTMLTMEPTSAVVGEGEGTIVDVASSNEDLSTLVTALKAANLVDALSGDGPITVFAPTNEAFENLPDGTLETLLDPENIEDLQSILTYHAANGMIMSSDLVTTPIATLNGEDVQVTVNEDGSVMINNANVVTADIMGGNGVVHIIDAVLLPPSKPEDGIGDGGSDESDAKYWPYQDDEGVKTCEYNADYSSVLVDGGLVFDTLAECCAIPGGEDITNCDEIQRAPPANRIADDDDDDDGNTYPTYSPTGEPDDFKEPLLSAQGEEMVAMEPFGLRFLKVTSGYSDETALSVTQGHLTHSFRTQGWDLARMSMMVLEEDRRRDRRVLAEVDHEIILGGVLYFSKGVDVPTVEDMESIIKASFENERLDYYIDLLEEEGMYVESVELDTTLQPNGYSEGGAGGDGGSSSFNWSGLAIGLSCSIVGLIMLVFGSRYGYNKYRLRQLNIDNLVFGDLEKGGGYRDYAIQLKKTNDEMEEGTAAETALDSKDQLSVPSLVQAAEDMFHSTPGGSNSYSSKSSGVSPLESPRGTSSTRYISVFTVKKDCGGKPLNQVDLRALAIAYLSRMLKKFPNTHLLPYDKTSTLPAIKNIRTLPDDLEELQQYVGNARVDDKTGKVLFNLRVESDEPVSKMKSSSGSTSSRSKASKKHTATPLPKQQSRDPSSPRSPGVLEDVDL